MKNLYENENEKKERKNNAWKKKAVAAALALTVVGVGGFTVHAVVDSLVKVRMESMSQEEKTQYVEEVDSMMEDASTYSRELTQEEKERERELSIAYHQDGRFPEGELKRVEDESEVDRDMLCFAPKNFYFYLPERTLTDEELLQIIDYQNKVNYALTERYENTYGEEIAARKADAEETKQNVEANGGLTDEEAVAKAREWLDKLYGKTVEGMEVSCAIDTEGLGTKELPTYEVKFSFADVDTYTFTIDATDGSLIEALYSGKELSAEEMSVSDGEAKAEALSQTAEKYLRDTFGISQECREVYYAYNTDENNTVLNNMMVFQFVMEDNMTYAVALDCMDGVLEVYKVQDYAAWQKNLETEKELAQKGVMNYEVVRNQLR
ncbi:MAG: hypothetical protein HDR01_06100 [Lachnospiraceae bacterium]|nr:hypothetical protein [Lachnospiraceae bacterium]